RLPRNGMGQDIQALAIWVLIIGVAGYLLFPTFFRDVFSRMSVPVAETSNLGEVTLPNTTGFESLNSSDLATQDNPSVYNSLYNGKNEVSSGYWAIFVAEGEFKQLSVTSESYAFLLRLIESDQKAVVKNSVILTANGQIQKYLVSDEIYTIINNMSIINNRTRTG
ncbi:MAG: hypothetical protein WA131_08250, partial [Desulfitobacteriaceae bacterium]